MGRKPTKAVGPVFSCPLPIQVRPPPSVLAKEAKTNNQLFLKIGIVESKSLGNSRCTDLFLEGIEINRICNISHLWHLASLSGDSIFC